jgi:hypothetical protein
MGRKQTGDELNARAKANGYKRGAHREEDSRRVTDTEINKEDRSEVYDVSIFQSYGQARSHPVQGFCPVAQCKLNLTK